MQQRRQKIAELVNAAGQISFSELRTAFPDVSEMTIRTDLKYLDEAGALIRIHGGAKSIEKVAGTDGLLSSRAVLHAEQKRLIAHKALSLLDKADSLFVDSGSTTTAFARIFPDRPCQIYTSGLTCATEFARLAQPSVHMLGGRLNRYSLSVAGSCSLLEISICRFDLCFIGATAFEPGFGFCCETEEDCLLKQAAIRQSSSVVLLIDSSKIGHTATHQICTAADVDVVVSDDQLTEEQRAYFSDASVVIL